MTPDISIVIWVPGELPSRNESENAARTNRYKAAKMKDDATTKVCYCVIDSINKINYGLYPLEKYSVSVTFHCKNKRTDPDNLMGALKYILDGLVSSSLVTDDKWKNVTGIQCSWTVSPNPGVEIRVRPE